MNNELYHIGMPRRSGRYPWGSGKNPYHHGNLKKNGEPRKKPAPKKADELSDEELKARINRMDNEKKYKALVSELYRDPKAARREAAKKFVSKVMSDSGTVLATGVVTYVGKKAVNKVFGEEVFEKVGKKLKKD